MEFERTAVTPLREAWRKFREFLRSNRRLFGWSVFAFAFILLLIFAFTLRAGYKQLETAFSHENEFVPTRLFSDVERIVPPMSRAKLLKRLKALGYSPTTPDSETLKITLHPFDYPVDVLLPPEDPTRELAGKNIRFTFGGEKKNSLSKIERERDGTFDEIPSLYLEPEVIATLSRSDPESKREIRRLKKFEDIPAPIWQAIISIEDPRYLEHAGLDPRGIARAFWVNIRSAKLAQGGSTITAQLVKNLMARRTRNIALKFNELFLSLLLEMKTSKEAILERYLNEVYLGQVGSYEIHGVAEGARLFYGKDLSELHLGEVALMAGLIRGPGFYSPYRYRERAVERQHLVLRKMVEAGFIAEDEAKQAAKLPLRFRPPVSAANKAPYFTDFVKAEMIRQLKDRISETDIAAAGFRVYTTLNPEIAETAQDSVARGVAVLEKKLNLNSAENPEERIEGALAVVDHKTGYIRALVGGRNYGDSTFNRILNMKRQVGSTFKPFVYLTAFLQGNDPSGLAYSTGYPVEDAPWTLSFDHDRQKWSPHNYEKGFLGWIPLRLALAKSINTVAAKLGVQVGIPAIIETARALGVQSDLPNVPSLSLGVSELSPVELVTAYSTIANHGVQDELTAIRAITQDDGTLFAKFVFNAKQVFPPAPIDLLIETMKSVFTEGSAAAAGPAYGFTRPAAGKTGTTSNYRDAWFAGFTPDLTTVVWVGADQNASLTEKKTDALDPKAKKKKKPLQLTGANGALPIWADFMKRALEDFPTAPFPESEHLKQVKIDRYTGKGAQLFCSSDQESEEWVMRDFEPKGSSCESHFPETQSRTSI
ncbi:MAG: transglycosylase domain-containing protein [Cryobacterium sp.]|nr:transglycosylase domain-containing protein [Oligoflexia bacterium]